jgi:predicted O-methyltransferase YrrM
MLALHRRFEEQRIIRSPATRAGLVRNYINDSRGLFVKINAIERVVRGLCCMTPEQAQTITDVILRERFQNILELGFYQGVSTCYIAGALDELGSGHLTTIDLAGARDKQPNVEQLLDRLGLRHFVTPYYEPTSYTWRLMKMLEADPSPRFDFCYLDGAHEWFSDGFAFVLVDRLLQPGGLIIFDDLDWTYDTSPSLKNSARVRRMPADERSTQQVRKVYDLLVKTHPDYGDFAERDHWGYARKRRSSGPQAVSEVRTEKVYEKEYIGLGAAMLKIARRIAR